MRLVLTILGCVFVAIAGIAVYAFAEAQRDPVIRTTRIGLADWPQGARPIRLVLAADLHVGNVAMGPGRLARMVAIINAQRPDIVVLAGDFVAGHDTATARRIEATLTQALRELRAPLGSVAVLGNHDHITNAGPVRRALRAGGVTLLDNRAVRRGALAIGGIDDMVTDHDDQPRAISATLAMPGAKVFVSHAPNPYFTLPQGITLLLAGHTHCGQAVFPIIGAPFELSEAHLRCGRVERAGLTTIVSGGLGTSVLPFRIGAPPDLWVLTLGPKPSPPPTR